MKIWKIIETGFSARETGNSIKPGVKTPGTKRNKTHKPVKTGDSL